MGLWALWISAVLLAIASAAAAYRVPKTGCCELLHWIIVIGWTMGPPTWFLLDATFRIQPGGKGGLKPAEEFFYDSAAKFWAGVLGVLLAIYSKNKWLS